MANYNLNALTAITGGAAVTPSDAAMLAPNRALWVGGAGNLVVVMADGQSLTLNNASGWMPLAVSKVMATGTTATGIVALY